MRRDWSGFPSRLSSRPSLHRRTSWLPLAEAVHRGSQAITLHRPRVSPPSTDSSNTPGGWFAPTLIQVVRGVSRSAGQLWAKGIRLAPLAAALRKASRSGLNMRASLQPYPRSQSPWEVLPYLSVVGVATAEFDCGWVDVLSNPTWVMAHHWTTFIHFFREHTIFGV